MAEKCGLIDPNKIEICWITDFPLFEKTDDFSDTSSFTAQSMQNLSEEDLLKQKSRAYDIVINGEEVGGGSIRIHDQEMQADIFKTGS